MDVLNAKNGHKRRKLNGGSQQPSLQVSISWAPLSPQPPPFDQKVPAFPTSDIQAADSEILVSDATSLFADADGGFYHDWSEAPALESPSTEPHYPQTDSWQESFATSAIIWSSFGADLGISADPVSPPLSNADYSTMHSWAVGFPAHGSRSLHSEGTLQSRASHTPEPATSDQSNSLTTTPSSADSATYLEVKPVEVSPYKDFVGEFGLQKQDPRIRVPSNGQVNGYLKFSCSQSKRAQVPVTQSRVTEFKDDGSSEEKPSSGVVCIQRKRARPSIQTASTAGDGAVTAGPRIASALENPKSAVVKIDRPGGEMLPIAALRTTMTRANIGNPVSLPPQYGYDSQINLKDQRLWVFYVNNWCPGRSILETNPWLKDFAQMHKLDGVCAAIQSLGGAYIYDYQPLDSVCRRVNANYAQAEARVTDLLNNPRTAEDENRANELITIIAILSMLDIVLTEGRRKRLGTQSSLEKPRWLEGFELGERFLQTTDTGFRFWKTSNVQLSSLRNSLSVIVGRAIILAQPMRILPPRKQFDAEREAARFGWLLLGTEKDMYQIHGGCGFSKKLLHVFSQITYCAARLQQDPKSPIVPVTAKYLSDELQTMRQWSSEFDDWDKLQLRKHVIDWILEQRRGYKAESRKAMTYVTAEAWRLAGMVYLRARVLRLPRNHPQIVDLLGNLAECIKAMPTSGLVFTAQAPLFPTFLLGLLSTKPEHKAVSKDWFDEVLSTPVRSSVPPLYATLQRIWDWIDMIIVCPFKPERIRRQPISERDAWWETMVEQVYNREQEILCLT